MATKIGIELPSDLLDAARITQIANRNKLSSRELNNKTKKEAARKIRNLPAISKQYLWNNAVPEYKVDLMLQGLSFIGFSWVGIERNLEFNGSEIKPDPCGPIDYSFSVDYEYLLFSSAKIKRNSYFKDTKLSYINNFDINENWTSSDSVPALKAYEEEKITKSMFYESSSSTVAITANIDTPKLLDISIIKSLSRTHEFAITGLSDCGNPANGSMFASYYSIKSKTSHSSEIYLSIPGKPNNCFLYVVWKESGSDLMDSDFPATYTFTDAANNDNHLTLGPDVIGTKFLSITYWDKNGNYLGSSLNFKATKKINYLSDANIFDESHLPDKLKGLITMVYDIGSYRDYIQSLGLDLGYVKFSFNVLPKPGVTILAERFLFFISPKNYTE